MMLYTITDWAGHFENSRSREVKWATFVCVPNKQDGDGYTELLDHPNGAAHYGAWMAIVLAASKCETRGRLMRDIGVPHDAKSLARMSRVPLSILNEAMPRLLAIGWLTVETFATKEDAERRQEVPSTTAEGAVVLPINCPEWNGMEGTEQNGTELNGTEPSMSSSSTNHDIPSPIKEVFEHYRKHHPKALRKPRKACREWKAVAARLEDGFTVGELCDAIDGCHKTPHNLGHNDQQQEYLGLELIMRTGDQVTRFIEANTRAGPVLSSGSRQTVSAIDSLMQRKFGTSRPETFTGVTNEHN